MWIDPAILACLGTLLVIACVAAMVGLILVRGLTQRYDRFRFETAEVLSQHHTSIDDLNTRLTNAGYPPGRLQPFGPR